MIDLKQFCGEDVFRPSLQSPFSRGEFTFATDGSVCVRVPRRDDVGDIKEAPNPESLFHTHKSNEHRALGRFDFPEDIDAKKECTHCKGSRLEHDCPDCSCECEACDGTGEMSAAKNVSCSVGGVWFAARYIRRIQTLPNLRIASTPKVGKAMHFVFDGGDGLLMPRTAPCDIDIPEIPASQRGT